MAGQDALVLFNQSLQNVRQSIIREDGYPKAIYTTGFVASLTTDLAQLRERVFALNSVAAHRPQVDIFFDEDFVELLDALSVMVGRVPAKKKINKDILFENYVVATVKVAHELFYLADSGRPRAFRLFTDVLGDASTDLFLTLAKHKPDNPDVDWLCGLFEDLAAGLEIDSGSSTSEKSRATSSVGGFDEEKLSEEDDPDHAESKTHYERLDTSDEEV